MEKVVSRLNREERSDGLDGSPRAGQRARKREKERGRKREVERSWKLEEQRLDGSSVIVSIKN